jgi:hypothetical protein
MDEFETNIQETGSKQHVIEAVVGLTLLVLAFFAIASSDVSAEGTRTYWSLLLLIFAVVAFVSDRMHTNRTLFRGFRPYGECRHRPD